MTHRHDFAIRKMFFCTTLLGVGSLFIKIGKDEILLATPLLYLVPLIAIAFDIYISVEDFRIKRIGNYLSKHNSPSTQDEKEWEAYVKNTPNSFKPFSFFLPTFLLAIASIFLLTTLGNVSFCLVFLWSTFIFFLQGTLIYFNSSLRNKLKITNHPET